MLDTDVLRNRVSTVGAAAQCQRRSELEVVKITDTTQGRRLVQEDTAGMHHMCVLCDLLGLTRIDEKRSSMSRTTLHQKLLTAYKRSVEILRLIHTEYRRELLMCERLCLRVIGHLCDEDLLRVRDLDAAHLSDLPCRLADDLCVHGAVDDDNLTNLLLLLLTQEVRTSVLELLLYLIIHICYDGAGLLRSTDHTIVEGLRMKDGRNGHLDICRRIDDTRVITCTYTECRCTGAVRCVYHTRTTGCKDAVCVMHDLIRHLKRRLIDPANDVLRSTCLDRSIENDLRSISGALLRSWVRADDDTISGL